MAAWKRALLLLILIAAALGCYTLGVTSGAISLLVLGAGLELCFWCGLLQSEKLRKGD